MLAAVRSVAGGLDGAGRALGIIAAGALLYWLTPLWKMRRDKLMPITREDDAALFDDLQQLAREAGLTYTPNFVWNPLDGHVGGQAFGRLGCYSIALTGGLATQFYTDRPAMRAVLLHELAHLRNKDVDRTYLALTITAAFFALAFAPFVLSLLVEGDTAFAFSALWRGWIASRGQPPDHDLPTTGGTNANASSDCGRRKSKSQPSSGCKTCC